MLTPEISIIIPTKDSGIIFDRTIEAVIASVKNFHVEIIVVNDSKTSQPIIPENTGIRLINNIKYGVASARNYGASIASSSFLLFIDDDILITRKSIELVFEFIEKHPNDCLNIEWDYPICLYKKMETLSFGRFLIKNGFTSQHGWAKDWHWEENVMFKIPLAASFFLLISKDIFNSVNGYNESFPFAGFEDYDFPKRLRKKGVEMYLDTSTIIYHNEEQKTNLRNWMQRNGAYTLKIGVEMGYCEKTIHYIFYKKLIYNLSNNFYTIFIKIGELLPNAKLFDSFNFKFFNFLLGLSIYKGYNKKIDHKF